MTKRMVILIMVLLSLINSRGECPADSVYLHRGSPAVVQPVAPMLRGAVLGVPLIAGGFAMKGAEQKFRDRDPAAFAVQNRWYDNCIQYTPAAVMLAMKAAGVESNSSWGEMLTADAFSTAIMCGAVQLMKHTIDEPRPDKSDDRSFPSGHTAVAFMTATMLRHEYGSRYPWLAVAGYGVAATTGFIRVERDKHWVGDVMAGAGVGIVSAELGYMVSDLIFHSHKNKTDNSTCRYSDDYNPSFIGLYLGYSLPTGNHSLASSISFKTASGTTLGLEGAWFFDRNFGAGGKITISNERFYINDNIPQSMPRRYKTALGGAYFSLPLTPKMALGAKITGGYCRYSGLTLNGGNTQDMYIPARGGFAFGTGLSFSAMMSQRISYRLFCDFDLLPSPKPDEGHPVPTLSVGTQVSFQL